MERSPALADPIPDQTVERKLERLSETHSSYAVAGSPSICAELDRYDVAVILQAVYEWGGYRYGNAADAIAAAKRDEKSSTRSARG